MTHWPMKAVHLVVVQLLTPGEVVVVELPATACTRRLMGAEGSTNTSVT